MTREQAVTRARNELNLHGLFDWGVNLHLDLESGNLGKCDYNNKKIVLNGHHIDIHPDAEVVDTILHEIAHILCPEHGHDEVWASKAKSLGAKPFPCSDLSFPPAVIDAIRSGHQITMDYDEVVVQRTIEEIVQKPKYTVTVHKEKCEAVNKLGVKCGKLLEVAKTFTVTMPQPTPDKQFITYVCGHTVIKDIPKGTPYELLIADAELDYVKNCTHSFEKNKCNKCGTFMPYGFQLEGMRFGETALTVHNGVAILDQMGLGKTIQALGLIKYDPKLWPVIYVVKSKIKLQWFKQILTWLGTEHLCQIIESSNDYLIPGLKGYIVGYDMLVPKVKQRGAKTIYQGFDINKFEERNCKAIVLDECQLIMNPDSTRTQQIRKLAKGKVVIGLSGTPWKNRGSEFFTILNMIAPTLFPSFQGFKDRWVNYYDDPKTGKRKEGGIKDPERFKDYISSIAIRRERTEVMKELPLINRMKLYCEMDKVSQGTYDDEVSDFVKWYNAAVIDGVEEQLSGINILAKMSRMRHITGLAKIPTTIDFVKTFFEETEDGGFIVFVHHKDVGQILLDNCKEELKELDIQVVALRAGEDSTPIVNQFNTRRSLCIASGLAAGEGVDGLQKTTNNCLVHERQWNPANEEQMEGRLLRIGQEADSVNATYAEGEDTIDTLFDAIVERKRREFYAAMSNSDAPEWVQDDLAHELAAAIVKRFNEKNRKKAS